MQRAIPRLEAWLESDSRRRPALALLGLSGLCALAFLQQLGDLGLMDKTEGLFVEVPRQMLLTGDWITPRWNGEPFFDYPVWGYWMVGLSYRLFGLSPWAARLPAALAASATVLALFAVLLWLAPAEEAQGRRVGRASLCAALLALSPGWVGWGRSSVTDMFLSSAIALALLGFYLAYARPPGSAERRLGQVALPLFAGIAVLAKGPVGLLLPGLVILVFLAINGRLLQQLRLTPLLPMAALFLGVTVPWYALATQANGAEFLGGFLGFSNLERFTTVIYDHPGPPWFYLPWVLLLLLPWSLFLPVAVARLRPWRAAVWRALPPGDDLALFALVWLVVVVAFFSAAATKLPGYILPALPGGALLVALLFAPLRAAGPPPPAPGGGVRLTGWVNAAVLALLAAVATQAPRLAGGDPAYPGFGEAVALSGLPLRMALILALAAAGLAVLLLRPQARRLDLLWIPDAAAFLAVLALVVPGLAGLMDRERLLPIRELARVAGRVSAEDEPLLVVGYKRYSVLPYSGRTARFVSSPEKARREVAGLPPSPTVLLFGSERELGRFGLAPGEGEEIASRRSLRLVRIPSARLASMEAP
ncbi:MAG: glycosyltransferase family 39 protein [Synechococcaceae cyanobacterium]|nr:glycosyltransferase family 39 protein [Synechococcaceae cyanobacterium]